MTLIQSTVADFFWPASEDNKLDGKGFQQNDDTSRVILALLQEGIKKKKFYVPTMLIEDQNHAF